MNQNETMPAYVDKTELKHRRNNEDVVAHPLDNLLQNERIRIILDELLAGKPKRVIVAEYAEKWNCKPTTVKNIMTEAIVNLHHCQSGNTIEEMRSEQVSKLEELYSQATVAEKLKIIDLVSETLGLYDNNVTVKTDDTIKINLGV